VKHRTLAFIACLALPLSALAASPELRIPNFMHLKGKAIESVDVTLDGLLLGVVRKLARTSDDPEVKILEDIQSVRVRNFTFDTDDAYPLDDVDSVRRQLAAPGWSQLVSAHKRNDEHVDVYLCAEQDKVLGLAVVASDKRSFTIVNIVGNIDIDKLAKLEGQFGIPKMDVER